MPRERAGLGGGLLQGQVPQVVERELVDVLGLGAMGIHALTIVGHQTPNLAMSTQFRLLDWPPRRFSPTSWPAHIHP